MRESRSGKNFEDWEYNHYQTKWQKGIRIDELRKKGSEYQYIRFTNLQGVCLVTGDYGRWTFCREFWPSGEKDSGVSDGYWCEKIQIYSEQEPYEFDKEATRAAIEQKRDTFEEWKDEDLEFFDSLLSDIDDELEYTYTAYRNKPSNWDYDDVPFCKDVKPQLKVIFDAFDEICNRLKVGLTTLTSSPDKYLII